jgi:hypothetical protein
MTRRQRLTLVAAILGSAVATIDVVPKEMGGTRLRLNHAGIGGGRAPGLS